MTMITIPDGHLATIVTHLEMTERPQLAASASPLQLAAWPAPPGAEYLALFRAVGEPWLWLSRLRMDESQLLAIIHDPKVEIFRILDGDRLVGIVELDFRVDGECEIGFFGLIPEYNGQGHGYPLMVEALRRAWRDGIRRVWLHTCTLDAPQALGFYRKVGFKPFARQIEMLRDPRLTGELPRNAGPHIPLIEEPQQPS